MSRQGESLSQLSQKAGIDSVVGSRIIHRAAISRNTPKDSELSIFGPIKRDITDRDFVSTMMCYERAHGTSPRA